MAEESRHGENDCADTSRRPSSSADTDSVVDADIMTQVLSTKSEEYRLLFRLPHGDDLVQDFNCALHENFLIQGHMYLFVHHICFYANIFGFETKRTIAFDDVTVVRKAKTAGIFPNAIEILVGEKKHFFGSFLSRDDAYRLIFDGWSQHNSEAKRFLDNQDSKTDQSLQDNALVMLENTKNSDQPLSDLNFAESIPDAFSEMQMNGVASGDCRSLGVSSIWQLDDVDAPNVPECFIMVAEANFPVDTEDFFHHFFSDDAIDFCHNFRSICGDTEFKCSHWRRHDQFGHVRDLSFDHPVKIIFGPKSGHCQERQKFRVYRNRRLVVETSQQISDVPFGDYFHVQGIWDVEQDCNKEVCHLKVYINVAFSRKLLWKGKIEQTTQVECRGVYGTWIKCAHELLKQKVFGKGQDSSHGAETRHDNDVNNSPDAEEHLEHLCTIKSPPKGMAVMLPVFRDFCSHICGPTEEVLRLSTSVLSIFKEFCMELCLHMKKQANIHLILATAFVAVFFLMQLIIILLLAKSPRIHIISQGNYINNLGEERQETVRWLQERVHNLKQEMQMVEDRLERMRLEYMFLRTHLQDLHIPGTNP